MKNIIHITQVSFQNWAQFEDLTIKFPLADEGSQAPIVFFIGIGCMGLEYLKDVENSWFFKAWLLATIGSFVYSVVTSNHTLFPDRHIEYIAAPLCFIVSVGIIKFIKTVQ